MSKHVPLAVLMAGLLCTTNMAAARSAAPTQSGSGLREAFGGAWALNRERSDVPGDAVREPGEDAGPGGGKVLIGSGTGRGVRIGGPGGGAGARGGSPDQMQAIGRYLRALNAPSDRLTIVVQESSVELTDADGRTERLQTDNKRIEGRAENGLVKLTRRTRWEGHVLVSEIDIDSGPRIRRRYELAGGGTELHITTEIRGRGGFGMGAAGQPRLVVYERPSLLAAARSAARLPHGGADRARLRDRARPERPARSRPCAG